MQVSISIGPNEYHHNQFYFYSKWWNLNDAHTSVIFNLNITLHLSLTLTSENLSILHHFCWTKQWESSINQHPQKEIHTILSQYRAHPIVRSPNSPKRTQKRSRSHRISWTDNPLNLHRILIIHWFSIFCSCWTTTNEAHMKIGLTPNS